MNAIKDTPAQYDSVIKKCIHVFEAKTRDYGTAWRVLRIISVVDEIYIKAQRIRTIQEKREQKVADDIAGEFMGIINYAIIGNIQLGLPADAPEELPVDEAIHQYQQQAAAAKKLMSDKNHDYGEAWRSMSEESFVDLILMKRQGIRQRVTN